MELGAIKNDMHDLFLGLISGTSMDGIDAVLADFTTKPIIIVGHHKLPYPNDLRAGLATLIKGRYGRESIKMLGKLDTWTGLCFAEAALQLLRVTNARKAQVRAIGSHGQTIFHYPNEKHHHPFSLQIANPHIIAERTGIPTIADFRSRDIAAGGQGAPLVPAFHRYAFFSPNENRAIVNIGGIANISCIPASSGDWLGFDSGPGNTLLDAWAQLTVHKPYDEQGDLAKKGKIIRPLLNELLKDPYFAAPPPKSTGPEWFNLERMLHPRVRAQNSVADIAATLTALSAITIVEAVEAWMPKCDRVLLCGGGVHNTALIKMIEERLEHTACETTHVAGIDPDWVEATAFAWLAKAYIENRPGNVPSATGASHEVILGAYYPGSSR